MEVEKYQKIDYNFIKYFVYERERKMVKLSTLCYIEQDGNI